MLHARAGDEAPVAVVIPRPQSPEGKMSTSSIVLEDMRVVAAEEGLRSWEVLGLGLGLGLGLACSATPCMARSLAVWF